MRLATFINDYKEPILVEWEDFARTLDFCPGKMDKTALRDHASHILDEIIVDLNTVQTEKERFEKSTDQGTQCRYSYAEHHAVQRLHQGYDIGQVVSEFRALRASVLKLWGSSWTSRLPTDAEDITRFNEAIDQALYESVVQFSKISMMASANAQLSLKDANRQKDEFLAMLAHELRNPLAPIKNASLLLTLSATTDAKVKEYSSIIARQVAHMGNLVDDLVDVSRVTQGMIELENSAVDLNLAVRNAIEQVWPLLEERHHKFSLHIPPQQKFVQGDKTRIAQILSNLLNNAAKFTPPGGEIVLAPTVHNSSVCISVKDNGSGIDPALVPHVFDLFVQSPKTSDRAQGGLGLGLALAKHLTNLHGGVIEVHSNAPTRGSTFTVVLPLLNDRDMHNGDFVQNEPEVTRVKPLRVMIVDDNQDAAQTLAMLLETSGHHVVVMNDAETVLKAADKDRIQVFILDIGLPIMDGYTLAKLLRATPETEHATLIALTGYGLEGDKSLAAAAGFDHHCVKPMNWKLFNDILSTIH